MCGICGFTWDDKELLKSMCNAIEHRGPDDYGFYTDKNISLGQQRLSIIDLTKGLYPIHNEDDSIQLIYNGEIYNFKELRADLERRGHDFYSNTDAEVIIHAYEEHGIECLQKFNGMFTFCLYDSEKQILFLARDRLGIKPLYYYFNDGKFAFASEIKALLRNSCIQRELNFKALDHFLTFRYNPCEETMLKRIKKLLPARCLIFQDAKIKIKRYWGINYSTEANSEAYYKKRLLELLTNSVKRRLISDVPLGVFLSGGMDSSTVVSLMSTLMEEPVKTFSVGFGFGEYSDELEYARVVADCFETDHHELMVEPESINILPKVIWHLDEPMADPAAIPTYLISELARKHVKVVLSGEGGDEQFAGYERVWIMKTGEKYRKVLPKVVRTEVVPRLVKKIPYPVLNRILKYSSSFGEEGFRRFSEYLKDIEDNGKSYLELASIFNNTEKKELYLKEAGKRIKCNISEELNKNYFTSSKELLNQLLIYENETRLPEDLLMKVDKMTMANSLEGRVPLLDHEIVEFAINIPENLKFRRLKGKYILRKTMASILPKEIINRKKMHFFVPIDRWFEGELGEVTRQVLSRDEIKKQKLFEYEYIEKCFKGYKNSKLFYTRQLWNLLTFQLWYKMYIESENLSIVDFRLDKFIK